MEEDLTTRFQEYFKKELAEGRASYVNYGDDYERETLGKTADLFPQGVLAKLAKYAFRIDDLESPTLAYLDKLDNFPDFFPVLHVNFKLAASAGLTSAELAAIVASTCVRDTYAYAERRVRVQGPDLARNIKDGLEILSATGLLLLFANNENSGLPKESLAEQARNIALHLAAVCLSGYEIHQHLNANNAAVSAVKVQEELVELMIGKNGPLIDPTTLASAYKKMQAYGITLPPAEEIDAEVQALMQPVPGQRTARV